MNPEAAIAFWLFVCTPAIALAFAIWRIARQASRGEASRDVALAILIGADFVFLVLGFLHYDLIGPAYSPRRYTTIVCSIVVSIALAVFAGLRTSKARNSLFVSSCLLTGIWLMNLGLSAVV